MEQRNKNDASNAGRTAPASADRRGRVRASAAGSRGRAAVRTGVHADCAHATCYPRLAWPSHLAATGCDQTGRRSGCATYGSVSESSVSRLLATLLARPSDSSLGYAWSTLGRRTVGRGGAWPSSWLVPDGLRFLLPLNSLAMRVWCTDEVSLRASSEFLRLRRRSRAPSVDLASGRSSLDRDRSLLASEAVDAAGPWGVAGAASEDSLLDGPKSELMLFLRSVDAMARGTWPRDQVRRTSSLSDGATCACWGAWCAGVARGLFAGTVSMTQGCAAFSLKQSGACNVRMAQERELGVSECSTSVRLARR